MVDKSTKSIQIVGHKGKKHWKKNKKVPFCKYCKLAGHKEEDYYFLHPNKAPKGWKNKLTGRVEKKDNKKDNHTRKKREQ